MGFYLSDILYKSREDRLVFWCPGCEDFHVFDLNPNSEHKWVWNGDKDKPSFHPSLHIKLGHYSDRHPKGEICLTCKEEEEEGVEIRTCVICHSWIKEGNIQFLNDCTHRFRGKTVKIPRLPDFFIQRYKPKNK